MAGPSPPHALDVWRNTDLVREGLVPYCSRDSDCKDMFKAHFTNGTQLEIDRLVSFIFCYSHVTVPAYYEDTMIQHNQSSDVFEEKVCSCDQSAIYRGDKCEPSMAGLVLIGLFFLTLMWIFALLVQGSKLILTQKLQSRRKRGLRVIGLLQYLGQIVWVLSTTQFAFIFRSPELSSTLLSIGFITCMLATFSFATGMILQTSSFLRNTLNKNDTGMKRKLHILDRVFVLSPLLVGSVAAYLLSVRSVALLLVLLSMATIVIIWAFTITARLLDKRIRRLLPEVDSREARREAARQLSRIQWITKRNTMTRTVTAANGPMQLQNQADDESVRSLLNSSRKLRCMVTSLRNAAARSVVMSGIYTASINHVNARWRWITPVIFCVMQISFAFVPMVGVSGLGAFKVIAGRKHARGMTVQPTNKQGHSAADSSDAGTLGG